VVKRVLRSILEVILIYLKGVLPICLALGLIVGASFFFWKPFSYSGLSERLVWVGLGIAMIAGFLVFSQTSGGRDFGVPGQFISTAHARTLTDWNREIRQDVVSRFGFRFRLFLIGLTLFGIGILVDRFFVA
jgi:hypothetical protein